MPLAAGARLGPYQITSALGAGGMGEVYRARDTRLDRDVAIKVVTEQVAMTPELKARFEREAKAISSLNHPNICTLFDVGHQDGVDFLVMELLEGESLATRLERGPLPAQELLRIAIQVADALDKAHRQRLVHRDLKPGNIMITRAGAKLLDFGLARPVGLGATPSGSHTPTMTRQLTAEGSLVGTFHYMAPEQLEGAEADPRTDLWALGVTLYEMATGKHAFEGRTQASLISSIMKDELRPIVEVQPLAPPGLDRIIRQCLAKDPEERIQTAHDVKLQLQWVLEGGSQAGVPAPVAERRRRRERLLGAVTGVALLSTALAFVWILSHRTKPEAAIRFQYDPPSAIQVMDTPVVSPDGLTIAFNATDSTGSTRIWLRPLGSLNPTPMPGTDGSTRPFWSPDSRYLGFIAGGKLKKVQAIGGPPIVICDAPTGSDGSWGERDVILYDGRGQDPIYRVPAGGGVPVAIVRPDSARGEVTVGWPCFLPGGRHFVYLTTGRQSMLHVGDLESNKSLDLFPCDSRAVYAKPGYLLFSRNGTLVAQPFDAASRKVKGDPVPIAEQVLTNAVGGADFSVSGNGVLAFAARGGSLGQVQEFNREGRVTATLAEGVDALNPALSPDGRRLALRFRDAATATRDVWVIDVARKIASRLTFEPTNENYPVWSPDGSQILYFQDARSNAGLQLQAASGAGRGERILPSSGGEYVVDDWSRDGGHVFYETTSEKTRQDVWVLPMTGDRKPFPYLTGPFDETQARISPNGRWLAYMSDESGRSEVYVQSFPDARGKWQVSNNGGQDPVWRGDGTELFYLSTDQQLMTMPVDPKAASFEVVIPKVVFPIRVLVPVGARNHYGVSSDGQRFYVVAPLAGRSVGTTNVVVHWTPEVRRR